ncbi:MAG TPA: Fic family protein [Kouleothrix sp.]|uniref:Fic family protein n=1 Tax=Kouleothrix sp. TaxID=2779161 RepID=UPI002C8C8B91|nr:Fic family protein [Kouleothrix sp.]HRC75857.1 Fic family protein [Kouleothrix sp.]
MNYLTRDDTLDLHAYVVTRYGGRLGVASQDRLASALDAPRQVLFGAELYPDLPSKAAALAFLLLKSRPFVGANEATALLALLRMLAINGARLADVSDGDLVRIIRAVNYSDLDREGLEAWLRDRLEAYAGG